MKYQLVGISVHFITQLYQFKSNDKGATFPLKVTTETPTAMTGDAILRLRTESCNHRLRPCCPQRLGNCLAQRCETPTAAVSRASTALPGQQGTHIALHCRQRQLHDCLRSRFTGHSCDLFDNRDVCVFLSIFFRTKSS